MASLKRKFAPAAAARSRVLSRSRSAVWFRRVISSLLKNVPALQSTPMNRSEEHTSELQSLMRISYAVFCLTKKHHHLNYDILTSNELLHLPTAPQTNTP